MDLSRSRLIFKFCLPFLNRPTNNVIHMASHLDSEKAEIFSEPTSTIIRLEDSALYKVFQPILWCLRISGGFFIQTKSLSNNVHFKTKDDRKENFYRAYAIIVFLFLVLHVPKNIMSYLYTEAPLDLLMFVNYSTSVLWYFSGFIPLAVCTQKCWDGSLPYLFSAWEKLRFPKTEAEISKMLASLRKTIVRVVIISLSATVSNICSTCYMFYATDPNDALLTLRRQFLSPFVVDSVVGLILETVCQCLQIFGFIFPMALFVCFGHLLAAEFHCLNDSLRNAISTMTLGHIVPAIEYYRLSHQKLCTLVRITDNVFAFMLLTFLAFTVFEQLCIVYSLYGSIENLPLLIAVAMCGWLMQFVLRFFVVMIVGEKVNKAARLPLEILYGINQLNLGVGAEIQLQTFIHKISTQHLGFTAFNLFTIRRATVLTICEMYLIYQVLVFGMQLDVMNDLGTTKTIAKTLKHLLPSKFFEKDEIPNL